MVLRILHPTLASTLWDASPLARIAEPTHAMRSGVPVRRRGSESRRDALRRARAAEVIVDSSAPIAILQDEPERTAFNEALARADVCQMSAATFVEVSIVVEAGHGYDGVRDLDLLMATAGITIVPVDVEQAHVAREAYRRYGKGRATGANLNYGDCFAYALAKATGLPLLFKGNDCSQTGIEVAS